MIEFLSVFLHVLILPFKTRAWLEAEIVMLRHQLNVLRRRVPSKPKLTVADRLPFVWLYRLFPSVLDAVAMSNRRPSSASEGLPAVLVLEVAQSTVAKDMARSGRGRSQTWKTFLHNHKAGIGAMDFLVVPTIGFRLHFVLVVVRHERRRLISLSVTSHPTADWIARQITDVFPWDEAPEYVIRGRDGCCGQAVAKRLAVMGIRDHPIARRSPWQNGHAERLIGSIRWECLDHIVVFGEAHLRRIFAGYADYYNELRTHLSLGKDAPCHRPVQRIGRLAAQPILGGLHHQYCRM